MSPEPDEVRRRPVTIYDVAREAGVAPSTVSRTYSRPGRVSAATAQRVRAVAEGMGYRTNPTARAMALGASRTGMVALVLSDISNPFYAEVVRGAQIAAAEAGATVLLVDAQESDQVEREALARTVPVVDGVLFASSRMSDAAIRQVASRKPVVVVNRAVAGVPSVVTDNPRGARRALEHLGSLGHQQVTYLAGPDASWAGGMRWRSLREAALELELSVRRTGPFTPDVAGGEDAAERVATTATTAVVAFNDLMAIGLLQGLATRGLRVPEDVSVVGFDDIAASALVTPPLTTVAAPLITEGTTAARHLLRMVDEAPARTGMDSGAITPLVLPVRLVVRGSTAPGRPRQPRGRAPGPAAR